MPLCREVCGPYGRRCGPAARNTSALEQDHHLGRERPVELAETARPESVNNFLQTLRRRNERCHVDTLARAGESPKVVQSAREHVGGTVMIVPLDVVQGDPDLQDPLIEVAHIPSFCAPEFLERFMLCEILAAIKLIDASDEEGRRLLVARISHHVDYRAGALSPR